MKNLLIIALLFSIVSCTDTNEKLLKENDTFIQKDRFLTNKEDITNVNNDGGEEPDNDEG